MPGKDWWQRFLKRWPSLAKRKPQHLSKPGAEAGDTEIIQARFDKVEEMLSSAGLDPSDPATAACLWNCDVYVSATKLLVRKGTKMVHEVGGSCGNTQQYTVQVVPQEKASTVHFVQGKELYQRWMQGVPAAAVYGISDWLDGWCKLCHGSQSCFCLLSHTSQKLHQSCFSWTVITPTLAWS